MQEKVRASGTPGSPAARRPIHRTRSTTLRSLSALMIFLFGGLSPVRTMLIIEGAMPFFLAHSFLPPVRLTCAKQERTAFLDPEADDEEGHDGSENDPPRLQVLADVGKPPHRSSTVRQIVRTRITVLWYPRWPIGM
jgi:hypothetical protein